MVVFNQTFYDLNGKRGGCVDDTGGLPADCVADLTFSVPNREEIVRLESFFVRGESIRLLFTTVSPDGTPRLVATFTSDQRQAIRPGEPYRLTAMVEGYGGLIVFGEGFRGECDVRVPLRISEECLTRYEPSCIPYVAITCRHERLTGEVRLSGCDRLVSDGIDVPSLPKMFETNRALRLALVDSGTFHLDNPMLGLLNGINADFGLNGSAVCQLFGALPDTTGTVTIRFDDSFHFMPVGDPEYEPSILALGTNWSTEDICRRLHEVDEEETEIDRPCKLSDIQFEMIEYAK